MKLLAAAIAFTIITLACGSAQATKRAMVIGLSSYAESQRPLLNPPADIKVMSALLDDAGYKVSVIDDTQGDKASILRAWRNFVRTVDKTDEVVVFYSGHGIDVSGANYIVPNDAPLLTQDDGEAALRSSLIALRDLTEMLADRRPAVQVWIVDACRVNPFSKSGKPFTQNGGLSREAYLNETAAAFLFSAGYGQVAQDRLRTDPPDHKMGSPFVRTFEGLFSEFKSKSLHLFYYALRSRVQAAVSPARQMPAQEINLAADWCFVECASPPTTPLQQQTQAAAASVSDPELRNALRTAAASVREPVAAVNAVYIGRLSAQSCQRGTVSDAYPFGCDTLQQMARLVGQEPITILRQSRSITAQTRVNVRISPPSQLGGFTVPSCRVGQLSPGESRRTSRIVTHQGNSETMLYALLDGQQRTDCLPN
jgi:hypothetical protein